jgi:hypothetical protein
MFVSLLNNTGEWKTPAASCDDLSVKSKWRKMSSYDVDGKRASIFLYASFYVGRFTAKKFGLPIVDWDIISCLMSDAKGVLPWRLASFRLDPSWVQQYPVESTWKSSPKTVSEKGSSCFKIKSEIIIKVMLSRGHWFLYNKIVLIFCMIECDIFNYDTSN